MIKLSNVIVLGGIASVIAWGANAKHQGDVAARAKAVATYNLTTQQATVYDGCLDALTDKIMKKGGGKQTFCGCFASTAADDEAGLKYSVDILKRVADRDFGDKQHPYLTSQGADYYASFLKTMRNAVSCAKAQQNVFSSKEEIATWCSATAEHSASAICQHRPL